MSLGSNIKSRLASVRSRIPAIGKAKRQTLTFGQGNLRNTTLATVQKVKGRVQGLGQKVGIKKGKPLLKRQKLGILQATEELPAARTTRVLQILT